MTGILLLFLIVAWLWFVWWLSGWILKRFTSSNGKQWLRYVLIALLIPLLVMDEIIGGIQFKNICKLNAVIEVDDKKIVGKILDLKGPSNINVSGIEQKNINAAIPILESTSTWVDAVTNKKVFTYKQYLAKGGWLVRTFYLTESKVPIIFSNYQCQPRNKEQIFSVVKTK